jgi:hypothetical protein
MDEQVLTYAGISQATHILVRDGLLDPDVALKDVNEGMAVLDAKATTWLRQYRERSVARTQDEQDEAWLMATFKLWIEGYVKLVETAEA